MDHNTILTKIALNAWQIQVDRCTQFVNNLTDEELMREVAPGKNRGIYLVGHLAAIHDAMPEILGIGKREFPELQAVFVQAADKTIKQIPSASELRQIWTKVHARLQNEFAKIPPDAWFIRHESMTDADFEKDPARNKLSVLNTRMAHLAFHFGQLRLLK
jgi:DinB superfamily